ncbi:hypothetical protein W97_05941 [Coniosporium apollinis CBS 100218]|uniref:Mid2 domain-containing protein n=1 Tax=Coniosporium apollinis (strain CBS 100218) TaxID=1168221 RepID=R7YXN0_CONA1|nr:uncharacterized protein W97_05941 [Coniosporium apollinis CBS 100218]EON66695.1 hypothetical protein W97_05941 [Coniosporium apollinis CBS 100218]
MGPSTLHKLSLVCLISSRVSASAALATALEAAQAVGLLRRQEGTCGGDASLSQCSGDLPSDFCCPSSSTCTKLNSTETSVICCPRGANCGFIRPINCDLQQQNATLHPTNPIHTTELDGSLPKCGDACCPFGFACEDGMCKMLTTAPTPGSPSTTVSLAVPTSAQTGAAISTIPATSSPPASSFPAKAVLAGLFPGLALGIILTLAIFFLLQRRRAKKARYSGDFGPVSRTVSDPIYNPAMSARTDFLRRQNSTSASQRHSRNGSGGSSDSNRPLATPENAHGGGRYYTSARSTPTVVPSPGVPVIGLVKGGRLSRLPSRPRTPKIRSLFAPKSPHPAQAQQMTSFPSSAPDARRAANPARDPYRTPTRQMRSRSVLSDERPKTGSTETIDVLMPGLSFLQAPPPIGEGGRGERPMTGNTTFSRLMEDAGFGRESRDRIGGGPGFAR